MCVSIDAMFFVVAYIDVDGVYEESSLLGYCNVMMVYLYFFFRE